MSKNLSRWLMGGVVVLVLVGIVAIDGRLYNMVYSRYAFTYYDGDGRLERTLWGSSAEIPSWIPVPKDSTMMGGSFHKAGLDPERGQIEIRNRMMADEVTRYYAQKFKDMGYVVTTEETTLLNVPKVYLVKARGEEADRTITITIFPGTPPVRAEIYFKMGKPAR